MPIVTITRPGTEPTGPEATDIIDLGEPKYDFRYLSFPSDLGMDYSGHYMVININVPTKMNGEPAGSYTNQFTATEQKSKVDTLRGLTNINTPFAAPVLNSVGSSLWSGGQWILNSLGIGGPPTSAPPPQSSAFVIPRATRRIVESVALYMPTPLVFSHQNEYQEISLTALGGELGSRAVNYVAGLAGGLGRGGAGGAVAAIGAAKAASDALSVAAPFSKLMQRPINPAVEVLFSNTVLRSFTFEVLMAPRNELESRSIKKIVKTLKFHSSPELSLGGLVWIPPAEFDITFFNKGEENTNILRINTCVLERIEVDYAPSGIYSTFRNGHPVAVRLSLGLREIEPVSKSRVLSGF